MTRKDYEAIAAGILPSAHAAKDCLEIGLPGAGAVAATVRSIAYNVAQRLSADNARFNAATFYVACGLTEKGYVPGVVED